MLLPSHTATPGTGQKGGGGKRERQREKEVE